MAHGELSPRSSHTAIRGPERVGHRLRAHSGERQSPHTVCAPSANVPLLTLTPPPGWGGSRTSGLRGAYLGPCARHSLSPSSPINMYFLGGFGFPEKCKHSTETPRRPPPAAPLTGAVHTQLRPLPRMPFVCPSSAAGVLTAAGSGSGPLGSQPADVHTDTHTQTYTRVLTASTRMSTPTS